MNKKMRMITSVITTGLLLCACGSKAKDFDVKALANDLCTQITYQDDLNELDMDTAAMFFNFSDTNIVNGVVYEGSGATAEEIVVIECASEEDAKKAETALKERIEEQKDSFTDYVPEELTKLNSPVIKIVGKYAVLSVSNDPGKASSIIDSYTK